MNVRMIAMLGLSAASVGCGFLSPTGDSGGGPGTPIECDVAAENDCERGEKCVPYDHDGLGEDNSAYYYNATHCVPVIENGGGKDSPCTVDLLTGEDNCAAGFICFDVETTEGGDNPTTGAGEAGFHGTCQPTCKKDEDSNSYTTYCDVGECVFFNNVVKVCKDSCDPYDSNCAADEYCQYDHWLDRGYCRKPGLPDEEDNNLGFNEGCAYNDQCLDGYQCAPASEFVNCADERCCTPYCDATKGADCPGTNQSCVDLQSGTFPDLGLCAIP